MYDFFNQFCPSVNLVNADWFINFDAGYDTACTGDHTVTAVPVPHQRLNHLHPVVLRYNQTMTAVVQGLLK